MTEKYKHIIVSPETHQIAKVKAVKNGKTLKDYIKDLVSEDKAIEEMEG